MPNNLSAEMQHAKTRDWRLNISLKSSMEINEHHQEDRRNIEKMR